MKKFKSILLIDDDLATNEFHKIIIELSGVADFIHAVESGQEGLDYLNSKGEFADSDTYPHPDLILLDINMPAMNGFEFIEEYNKLPKENKAKQVIIMLTASLNPDDKQKAEKTNIIEEYINKPLTKDVVVKLSEKYGL